MSSKVFYIADTHFCHGNIIRLDGRPFTSVEEMDETMIGNWNRVVNKGDVVYILGDFCWGKEPEWLTLADKLNGSKFLIKGNHDVNMSATLKSKFAWVGDYKEVKDSGLRVILNHYPLPLYRHDSDENFYMLHGHVHNTREYDLVQKIIQLIKKECETTEHKNKCQLINVGCMMPWMDYTPRTIQEIVDGYKEALEEQKEDW